MVKGWSDERWQFLLLCLIYTAIILQLIFIVGGLLYDQETIHEHPWLFTFLCATFILMLILGLHISIMLFRHYGGGVLRVQAIPFKEAVARVEALLEEMGIVHERRVPDKDGKKQNVSFGFLFHGHDATILVEEGANRKMSVIYVRPREMVTLQEGIIRVLESQTD